MASGRSVAIHSTCDLQAEIMQLNPTMRFIPDANLLVAAGKAQNDTAVGSHLRHLDFILLSDET